MKRRNFLKNAGLGVAATMIPVSVLASTKPTKNTSIITSFDAHAALKDNPHFKILEKYARYETGTQKRNKIWLTGSTGYNGKNSIDEIQVNILFESNHRGFYLDVDSGEHRPLDGVIVKDRFTLDSNKDINEQVNDAYDSFFNTVMMHHFGVERTRVSQKGMYDDRQPKNIIKSK